MVFFTILRYFSPNVEPDGDWLITKNVTSTSSSTIWAGGKIDLWWLDELYKRRKLSLIDNVELVSDETVCLELTHLRLT